MSFLCYFELSLTCYAVVTLFLSYSVQKTVHGYTLPSVSLLSFSFSVCELIYPYPCPFVSARTLFSFGFRTWQVRQSVRNDSLGSRYGSLRFLLGIHWASTMFRFICQSWKVSAVIASSSFWHFSPKSVWVLFWKCWCLLGSEVLFIFLLFLRLNLTLSFPDSVSKCWDLLLKISSEFITCNWCVCMWVCALKCQQLKRPLYSSVHLQSRQVCS